MSPSLVMDPARLARVRQAYTLRAVPRDSLRFVARSSNAPRPGDVVIARVEMIGHHKAIELASGRKAQLYPGDEIALCYGNRYAPDQFEAEVPADLGPCHLVAAGGLAGRVLTAHERVAEPTSIVPIGLVTDTSGRPINLIQFGRRAVPYARDIPVIAVVGTAMNAGKTTTAAAVVHGLVKSGLRVGAAKVTGTGAGNDLWTMRDAGAYPAYDFTDMGVPSTYMCDMPELQRIFLGLIDALVDTGVDVAVIEVADGLQQRETAMLIESDVFRHHVKGVVFAAYDAMGADAGVRRLRAIPLPVLAIGGRLTQSSLAMREAHDLTGLPVLTSAEMHVVPEPVRAAITASRDAGTAAIEPVLAESA